MEQTTEQLEDRIDSIFAQPIPRKEFTLTTSALIGAVTGAEGAEKPKYAIYTLRKTGDIETVAEVHNRIYKTTYNAWDICGLIKMTHGEAKRLPKGSKVYIPLIPGQPAALPPRITNQPRPPRNQPTPDPEPRPSTPERQGNLVYPRHWDPEVIRLINLEHDGDGSNDGGLDKFLQRRFRDPNQLITESDPSNQISLTPLPQPNNSADRFVPDRTNFAKTNNWETYICVKLQPVAGKGQKQKTSFGYVGFKHPQRGLVLTHSFYFGQGKKGSETPAIAMIAGSGGKEVSFEEDVFGANYWSLEAQEKANKKSLRELNTKMRWNLSYDVFVQIGECASFAEANRRFRLSESSFREIKKVYIPRLKEGEPLPRGCQWGYMANGRIHLYAGYYLHGTGADWTAGLAGSRGCGRMRKKDFPLLKLAFGFRHGSGLDIQRVR